MILVSVYSWYLMGKDWFKMSIQADGPGRAVLLSRSFGPVYRGHDDSTQSTCYSRILKQFGMDLVKSAPMLVLKNSSNIFFESFWEQNKASNGNWLSMSILDQEIAFCDYQHQTWHSLFGRSVATVCDMSIHSTLHGCKTTVIEFLNTSKNYMNLYGESRCSVSSEDAWEQRC